MAQQQNQLYEFGPFRLDTAECLLLQDGKPVPLTPKAFQTLLVLVENHGCVVEKNELLQKVWPDTYVEEATLAQNVFTLRKQLSDDRNGKQYIETIPKRGYRFTAEVEKVGPKLAPAVGTNKAEAIPPGKNAHWNWGKGIVLVAAVAILLASSYWLERRFSGPHSLHRVMLAVLPAQNLTGDSSLEFLTDGLTEELISQLGGINPRELGVIARTSAMTYKNSQKTIAQIGGELDVDYVLETSARGDRAHLRFTAHLIRTAGQNHLWTHNFDRSLHDVVPLQDDVSRAIAQQIQLHVSPAAAQRMERELVLKPASYEAYLQGRYACNRRTREGLEQGVSYFKKAVQADPANARAYAGIADAFSLLMFYGYAPGSGSILRAKEAAQKAVELDDSQAEGHASLAYVYFMWTWQWSAAEQEFQRAIQLNENYATAHHWYGLYLAARGRRQEAEREIQRAQRLDPRSSIVAAAAGYIQYFGRDYDGTIRVCQELLSRNPNFMVAHDVLALGYEAKGRYTDAIKEAKKAVELSGGQSDVYKGDLAHIYAVSGDRSAAQQIIVELEKLRHSGDTSAKLQKP